MLLQGQRKRGGNVYAAKSNVNFGWKSNLKFDDSVAKYQDGAADVCDAGLPIAQELQ
jgi:hypothetical protein